MKLGESIAEPRTEPGTRHGRGSAPASVGERGSAVGLQVALGSGRFDGLPKKKG
jgi:hypothetical protein